MRTTWTRERALEAARAFYAEHGYQPVCNEASPRYGLPSWAIVHRLFGGWNAYMEAAGFVPYPARSSTLAKAQAWRDRHPGGVEVSSRVAPNALELVARAFGTPRPW